MSDVFDDLADCQRCDGEGMVLTCIDDMCRGTGECIHGDGWDPCPDCNLEELELLDLEDQVDALLRVTDSELEPRARRGFPGLAGFEPPAELVELGWLDLGGEG